MHSRLALGTVQFGLEYGVANRTGRVGQDEAARILARAREAGMDTLDTAVAYGESEQTLGRIGVRGWRIVGKLPGLPARPVDVAAWVRQHMTQSLARLGVDSLHAVLLHRPADLFGPQGGALLQALQQLRTDGLAGRIGVSVYAPDELQRLYGSMHFDIVQIPLNILDRRVVESGWADRLAAMGAELHVRSVFLQGLLLLPASGRPAWFGRWDGIWQAWQRWLDEHRLTPLQACLRYALSVPGVDRVVIGVDHAGQLQEILDAASGELPGLPAWPQPVDADLINPGRWSQT